MVLDDELRPTHLIRLLDHSSNWHSGLHQEQ